MPPKGFRGPRPEINKETFPRLIKMLFKNYKWQFIAVAFCVLVSALAGSSTGIFLEKIITAITVGDAESLKNVVIFMASLFVLAIAGGTAKGLIMANVTQGFLKDIRVEMFDKMQNLPIKYFDTNTHGDIMSMYTNDVDALRQLVSESLISVLQTFITLLVVVGVMLYYSIWLTLIVGAFIALMMFSVKKIGGNSAKYFVKQQASLGKLEGFVEEGINGQKVIKVFTHEEETKADFDVLNEQYRSDATKANTFANILGPIMNNMGHFLYVFLAVVGTLIAVSTMPESLKSLSISGKVIDIAIIVAFLPMSKTFSQNISHVSQQINSVFLALAGAERIFALIDETPEVVDGYVTLVNAKRDETGNLVESQTRTGLWAWKHPHGDGTTTYTELKGDVVLENVNFGYNDDTLVLKNISIYAKPGQKVAFVGATGAGKTTITNLLNRFYNIQEGKIRYDGININKIKLDDLRRSLGMVLQDTTLFTGTVMDNIRYGRLDATDEECINASKLAGADDFIARLPDGYQTELTADGTNLSQGQRQLLSIARATVADAPVMILDEATSSIDTRTESLVQKGTDTLMEGRTVFVIAHRLSTVRNSNVIMVLDHGVIIERGSHNELLDKKGSYYELYNGSFDFDD